MKILQLAGTSDARELALLLSKEGHSVITTVVTENAAKEMKAVGIKVQVGRMTDEDICSFIKKNSIDIVVDGSHPFAEEASKNAIIGAKQANVPYIRYERESKAYENEKLVNVNSYDEAADYAFSKKGVIMLLTGSKTLQVFTKRLSDLECTRVLARMLPRKDNLDKCEELGFPQKNIIAIQGPFTKEFNQALFKQYGVSLVVTKESGKQGSVDEKVEAALELGIETVMIKRPKINYGTAYANFKDIVNHLKAIEDKLIK